MLKRTRVNGIKIRTRCRICGRSRYLNYLRPSVTHERKWMCKDDKECVAYYKYQLSLTK